MGGRRGRDKKHNFVAEGGGGGGGGRGRGGGGGGGGGGGSLDRKPNFVACSA